MSFRDDLPAHPPYLPSAIYEKRQAAQVEAAVPAPSFEDDFLADIVNWCGHGAAAATFRAEAGHPGIVEIRTLGAVGALQGIALGTVFTSFLCAWSDIDKVKIILTPKFNVAAPAAALVRFGLFSDVRDVAPAHGAYFEKLDGFTRFTGVCRDGGLQSTSAAFTTAPVSGQWLTMTIRRIGDFSVGFTLNDEAELIVDSNTPGRDDPMHLGLQIRASTAVQQQVDLDYVRVQFIPLSR